jgi:hypothetical protein
MLAGPQEEFVRLVPAVKDGVASAIEWCDAELPIEIFDFDVPPRNPLVPRRGPNAGLPAQDVRDSRLKLASPPLGWLRALGNEVGHCSTAL